MDWTEDFDSSLLDGDVLNFLIEHNHVEGAAAGITKKVITHGLNSLTIRQRDVFKTYVVDEWLMRKCKCGDHEVEGDELIGLWVNEGYCSRCASRMEKDERR